MLPPTTSTDPPRDNVIPNCCNIGVVFRTLLAVNGVVFAASLLQFNQFKLALFAFAEASILMESASLATLIVLCGLRKMLQRAPAWGQRLLCASIPAWVTGGMIHWLSNDTLLAGIAHPTVQEGMSLAALFGIVLQHYFELRTRAVSPALAQARLQALQARIRPHFLFNSLNTVLALIRTEPRRAESTLQDLADLFRVLMNNARDITTLEDEVRLCKQYLAIEQTRLGERLEVQWDMTALGIDVLRKAQVPALLLQPLLENAVRHGVEPAQSPVLIQIHLSCSVDRIEITVINPIALPEQGKPVLAAGNNMALENIRQRLILLHDVEAELTTVVAQGLFKVRLRFPYVHYARQAS